MESINDQPSRETVLKVISADGSSLQYHTEEFNDDREIVLTAVKQNGYALEYAYIDWSLQSELIWLILKIDSPKKQSKTSYMNENNWINKLSIFSRIIISRIQLKMIHFYDLIFK